MSPDAPDVTKLLKQWRAGHEQARDQLISVVYDQLRKLAAHKMKAEHEGHTLKPTAVVHEAYLRLMGAEVDWHDRAHFFAVAAQTMRRVLIDHAKASHREKRGSHIPKVSLDEAVVASEGAAASLLELDEAMHRLAKLDARKSDLIELHYFGGLTYEESATVLGISPATVHRELKLAKAWLRHELIGQGSG